MGMRNRLILALRIDTALSGLCHWTRARTIASRPETSVEASNLTSRVWGLFVHYIHDAQDFCVVGPIPIPLTKSKI